MRKLFEVNPANLNVKDGYLGVDNTEGFRKRIADVVDTGLSYGHPGAAPNATVDELIVAISKYYNHYDIYPWGHPTYIDFWREPLVEGGFTLFTMDDIVSGTDDEPNGIFTTTDTRHYMEDGMVVRFSGIDGDYSRFEDVDMDLWIKFNSYPDEFILYRDEAQTEPLNIVVLDDDLWAGNPIIHSDAAWSFYAHAIEFNSATNGDINPALEVNYINDDVYDLLDDKMIRVKEFEPNPAAVGRKVWLGRDRNNPGVWNDWDVHFNLHDHETNHSVSTYHDIWLDGGYDPVADLKKGFLVYNNDPNRTDAQFIIRPEAPSAYDNLSFRDKLIYTKPGGFSWFNGTTRDIQTVGADAGSDAIWDNGGPAYYMDKTEALALAEDNIFNSDPIAATTFLDYAKEDDLIVAKAEGQVFNIMQTGSDTVWDNLTTTSVSAYARDTDGGVILLTTDLADHPTAYDLDLMFDGDTVIPLQWVGRASESSGSNVGPNDDSGYIDNPNFVGETANTDNLYYATRNSKTSIKLWHDSTALTPVKPGGQWVEPTIGIRINEIRLHRSGFLEVELVEEIPFPGVWPDSTTNTAARDNNWKWPTTPNATYDSNMVSDYFELAAPVDREWWDGLQQDHGGDPNLTMAEQMTRYIGLNKVHQTVSFNGLEDVPVGDDGLWDSTDAGWDSTVDSTEYTGYIRWSKLNGKTFRTGELNRRVRPSATPGYLVCTTYLKIKGNQTIENWVEDGEGIVVDQTGDPTYQDPDIMQANGDYNDINYYGTMSDVDVPANDIDLVVELWDTDLDLPWTPPQLSVPQPGVFDNPNVHADVVYQHRFAFKKGTGFRNEPVQNIEPVFGSTTEDYNNQAYLCIQWGYFLRSGQANDGTEYANVGHVYRFDEVSSTLPDNYYTATLDSVLNMDDEILSGSRINIWPNNTDQPIGWGTYQGIGYSDKVATPGMDAYFSGITFTDDSIAAAYQGGTFPVDCHLYQMLDEPDSNTDMTVNELVDSNTPVVDGWYPSRDILQRAIEVEYYEFDWSGAKIHELIDNSPIEATTGTMVASPNEPLPYHLDVENLNYTVPGARQFQYQDWDTDQFNQPGAVANGHRYFQASVDDYLVRYVADGILVPASTPIAEKRPNFCFETDANGRLTGVSGNEFTDNGNWTTDNVGRYASDVKDMEVVVSVFSKDNIGAPSPAAPSIADEENFGLADDWLNESITAEDADRYWPEPKRPKSIKLNIAQPSSNTTSQSGIKYVRSAGYTVWSMEVAYPPLTEPQWQEFHGAVMAARGQKRTFKFNLKGDDGKNFLFGNRGYLDEEHHHKWVNGDLGSSNPGLTIADPAFDEHDQYLTIRETANIGDTVIKTCGWPSWEDNPLPSGTVVGGLGGRNGQVNTIISSDRTNIYGEYDFRLAYPLQQSIAKNDSWFPQPDWVVVSIEDDNWDIDISTAKLYGFTIRFRLDWWR